MGNKLIFIAIGLLAAASAHADAYTWTDEDGVVHYSDRPNPGAKRIDLFESGATRPRPTPRRVDADSDEDTAAAGFSYQKLEISSPVAEETLWNIETVLNVSLTLSPTLRPGHQVRVYFDGKQQMASSANFRLQVVHRGAHNLQVEIIDETGKLMIRSLTSRFYVQQTSVL
jgi:hypothetical protein